MEYKIKEVDSELLLENSPWKLHIVKKIAETPTCEIFEVVKDSELLILKLYSDLGWEDEKGSISVLSAWNGNGAVKIVDHVEKALLMEKLEEPNLYSFSSLKQEDQASDIFCGIVEKIHRVDIALLPEPVKSVNEIIKPLLQFDVTDQLQPMFDKAKRIAEELIRPSGEMVILHGDLHHENVLKRSDGKYVCFDPKGYVGDPAYEIATILKNPWHYPEISESEEMCLERAEYFAKALGFDLGRVLKFAFVHMGLSVMWSYSGGHEKYNHQLSVMNLLNQHL
jgi:streptomycin 6-kinase